ncbi:hypothetical protein EE612_052637 [Oryza sativa]|nr:hypothetical protein EE612_052637 [Oryza sativa]
MYSPQPPSDGNPDDGALARPRRQLSTASAADSLAVFALAKLIDDRATHQADPQLALALAFAICARFQERSITFDSSSYHKLGDDSGAFTTKNDDDFRHNSKSSSTSECGSSSKHPTATTSSFTSADDNCQRSKLKVGGVATRGVNKPLCLVYAQHTLQLRQPT